MFGYFCSILRGAFDWIGQFVINMPKYEKQNKKMSAQIIPLFWSLTKYNKCITSLQWPKWNDCLLGRKALPVTIGRHRGLLVSVSHWRWPSTERGVLVAACHIGVHRMTQQQQWTSNNWMDLLAASH